MIDFKQGKHTTMSVGKVLAGTPCLLNHSCFPNAQIIMSGNHVVVKTIAPVARGEAITVCYRPGVILTLESPQDRMDYLREVFYFDCDCQGK